MKAALLLSIKIITVIIFVSFSIVWFISPFISNKLIAPQLVPYNLTLSDESHFRYNPFLSSLTIKALTLQQKDKTVFSVVLNFDNQLSTF